MTDLGLSVRGSGDGRMRVRSGLTDVTEERGSHDGDDVFWLGFGGCGDGCLGQIVSHEVRKGCDASCSCSGTENER